MANNYSKPAPGFGNPFKVHTRTPNRVPLKGFEHFYSDVTKAAMSTVQHAIIIEGTRDLRRALKEMDRKLDQKFHRQMAAVVRKQLKVYKSMAPTSAPKGRRVYHGGSKAAAASRPWGSKTYKIPGGTLRKSLIVAHTAKGVRVMTGRPKDRKKMYYASIVHSVRITSHQGRVYKGNPYLWKARDATRQSVLQGVDKLLREYIDIVDRQARGEGP